MSDPVEFYFDFSSPYGYLAATGISQLAGKYGRELFWGSDRLDRTERWLKSGGF
jgi:2-hydroxychromene-2-carboxylate isomerase